MAGRRAPNTHLASASMAPAASSGSPTRARGARADAAASSKPPGTPSATRRPATVWNAPPSFGPVSRVRIIPKTTALAVMLNWAPSGQSPTKPEGSALVPTLTCPHSLANVLVRLTTPALAVA